MSALVEVVEALDRTIACLKQDARRSIGSRACRSIGFTTAGRTYPVLKMSMLWSVPRVVARRRSTLMVHASSVATAGTAGVPSMAAGRERRGPRSGRLALGVVKRFPGRSNNVRLGRRRSRRHAGNARRSTVSACSGNHSARAVDRIPISAAICGIGLHVWDIFCGRSMRSTSDFCEAM